MEQCARTTRLAPPPPWTCRIPCAPPRSRGREASSITGQDIATRSTIAVSVLRCRRSARTWIAVDVCALDPLRLRVPRCWLGDVPASPALHRLSIHRGERVRARTTATSPLFFCRDGEQHHTQRS
eukprot:917863-Prymnesium_polylepis.2